MRHNPTTASQTSAGDVGGNWPEAGLWTAVRELMIGQCAELFAAELFKFAYGPADRRCIDKA
jgi:hypothetical protein